MIIVNFCTLFNTTDKTVSGPMIFKNILANVIAAPK